MELVRIGDPVAGVDELHCVRSSARRGDLDGRYRPARGLAERDDELLDLIVARRQQPPDDEIEILGAEERDGVVVARYAWLHDEGRQAGEMLLDGARRSDPEARRSRSARARAGLYLPVQIATTSGGSHAMELIHTCYRITDIRTSSVAFYEALGFEKRRRIADSRGGDERASWACPATTTGWS